MRRTMREDCRPDMVVVEEVEAGKLEVDGCDYK